MFVNFLDLLNQDFWNEIKKIKIIFRYPRRATQNLQGSLHTSFHVFHLQCCSLDRWHCQWHLEWHWLDFEGRHQLGKINVVLLFLPFSCPLLNNSCQTLHYLPQEKERLVRNQVSEDEIKGVLVVFSNGSSICVSTKL